MKTEYKCGCKYDLTFFLGNMNHLVDIISDDDRIRLCEKHMNLLINDYIKLLNRIIAKQCADVKGAVPETFKEKIRLVKLYQKDYPNRLRMLKEIDQG